MPSINMIAARRAESKKLESRTRVVLLVVIAEVVLLFGMLSFMTARAYTANNQISRLNKDLEVIQPTVDKINEYENQIRELKPRRDLLVESRDQTDLWYNVLQNLSKSMAQSTWLNSVTTSQSNVQGQVGKQITLRGISVSQQSVGETMLRLNQWPEFKNVNLGYTAEGTELSRPTLDFEIAVALKDKEQKKGGSEDNVKD